MVLMVSKRMSHESLVAGPGIASDAERLLQHVDPPFEDFAYQDRLSRAGTPYPDALLLPEPSFKLVHPLSAASW
jgi:hypothetical protein